MLFVLRSNRTELLFDALAERLARPGRDPLARAVVVVQGAGMERWLAQRLARRFGVCANVAFPFPRPFLEEILAGEPSAWDRDRMTFALAQELESVLLGASDSGEHGAVLAPLRRAFFDERGEARADASWRLIELAHRIALVFDQILTYRPDWIRAWEEPARPRPFDLPSGPDADWQAHLVRRLGGVLGRDHVANRAADFVAALAAGAVRERGRLGERLRRRFPDAVEIFAVSTLPPLHLAVVRALATVVDVRLSILVPSRVWYSDLWRELRDVEGANGPPIARLLAGLGRLGADFQRVLEENVSPDGGEQERYFTPASDGRETTMLERLQAQLLDLEEDSVSPEARRITPDDASIQVHLCHGPRRELEAIESILRAAFERDPTLAPEDVIVMAPDIDAIAADIDAVFGALADERGAIPYRIADRGTWRRSPVADAFRGLLELAETRMTRSAVFDWLALRPVAARFGLDERAVESLADWAERAGHRFGLDDHQRERLGLPADRRHTLAGSLDRLVLAHALGATDDVVAGLSPVALDAFAEPAWLGALGDLEGLLGVVAEETRARRSVSQWADVFGSWLERAIAKSDADSHEHAAIRTVLESQRAAALSVGFTLEIPFAAMRDRVLAALEQASTPQAFLAGGVTFCQLVPLRAIPFRIVVVTGLVDGAFPRSRAAVGFDAMATSPRPGDRTARDDDRHLFLEAILSARERLVLTVPARDLRDGAPRPPSIVVSELLDALDEAFECTDREKLRDQICVEHPLQATSARYFEPGRTRDARLVSRSEHAYRAALARARAAQDPERAERRFLAGLPGRASDPSGAIPATRQGSSSPLTLDALIERVLRSTRHFARHVLGLRLPRPEEAVGDLDPIALSPLERSALGRAFFERLAQDDDFERSRARLAADPRFASGEAGELVAAPLAAEVRIIARIAAERRRGRARPDFPFVLALALPSSREKVGRIVTLTGLLDGLHDHARIEADYGRIEGRREAALWIRHLVLCALVERGESLPSTSVFVGRPPREEDPTCRVLVFEPVAEAGAELARLVQWAQWSDSIPLPLFERASAKFARAFAKSPGNAEQAWRDARSAFDGRDERGDRFAEGEQELETVRVWEGHSPIATAADSAVGVGFDVLANAFHAPLLAARRRSPR